MKFKREYKIKTTSEFYDLILKNDISEIINFKGKKIDRIIALTKFLKNEKVETEDDLFDWLLKKDNLLALANINGIKSKTIDYLKLRAGHKNTVAVDVRLINFIKMACPEIETLTYEYAHELLLKTSQKLRIEPSTLDFSIWSYMSKSGAKKATKIKIDSKEIDLIWNGYCPESQLKGKQVRMKLNSFDFYESEETGLQIALIAGVQAVILNFRGKGKFKTTTKFADEIENGEFLSPQNSDKPPFNNPTIVFQNTDEIAAFIKSIK